MSDDTTKFLEVNIVPKFLDAAIAPVAKEAGERLADIVSLVFTPIIKARAKRDKNLEKFLKNLENKVNEIPEEKIQEPQVSIVCPILEMVAKFYHDEEYLQELFARLIASSMNKECKVHPAYIKVIEQLSAYDAKIFESILFRVSYTSADKEYMASKFVSGEFLVFFVSENGLWEDAMALYTIPQGATVPLPYSECELLIGSLANLERLGLIHISEPINTSLPPKFFPYSKNSAVLQVTVSISHFGFSFAKACLS